MTSLFGDDCHKVIPVATGGSGHSGVIGFLAILLVLLFIAFGRGLHGGRDTGSSYNYHGGIGPADFSAINTFANAVPQPQAEIMRQQAVDTGILAREINLGKQETNALIASTAHTMEIGALRDQLAQERMSNLEYRVNANTDSKVCALQAQISAGFCETLKRPQLQPAVGLPEVGCTNFGNFRNERRPFFGVGEGCC